MEALRQAYETLRQREPHLYLREAAERLGVSEMELLRLDVGKQVTRLSPDIPSILESLPSMGPLKALSRNRWVVIETTGSYPRPYTERHVMVFASSGIDLRIYLLAWKHVFAVRSFGRDGQPLYSIQFFTEWGEAVHKVYLTTAEQLPLWESLVQTYRHADQSIEAEPIASAPPSPYETPLSPDVQAEFLKQWGALGDTHEFFELLRRFRVGRLTAVQIAEGRYAWQLPTEALHRVLEWAKASQTPIMFFVGNAGIHHIYSGTIQTLSLARGWLNVLDSHFNLHINPAGIGRLYLVCKPTKEGPIYSVEAFGPQGEEVLWVFGARKPGTAVPPSWQAYVQSLIAATA
ncbi:MAG: hemin-degrading factor [Bacteroidia bacterium]|nr:hemin-degrading factor [Bacteroidia bacterium]